MDTYSLEQLGHHARWILRYQTEMLNLLLAPLAGMQGQEWKPHKVSDPAKRKRDPRHHRNADYGDDLDAKESALNLAMARKFRVRIQPGSGGEGSAGVDSPSEG